MPPEHLSNHQIAQIFQTIADLLEIKGEVIYKILAYRKASESLENLGRDVYGIWQEGGLTEIPGVGKAIAEKIEELLTTGNLGFYDKLRAEVPPTLADMLQVPDLGPKKIALFWREQGITSLPELEVAAREGRLRDLPGMGEKSEARIIAGIEALSRRSNRIPLGRAYPFAGELLAFLRGLPGVSAAEAAGSLRRMRPTVGDIDLLVAAPDSSEIMRAFTSRPDVARILGQGATKSSVEFVHGLQAQLWVHPPERYGTALQYATGSKDHNVRLRELALKKGLSLSEHALTRTDGSEITCEREEEVYAALGLPWIAPELREDRGEVKAALSGELPELLAVSDIHADLHTHSTWSDGRLSIREMANAAHSRGLKVLAVTDHSVSLGVAGGLSIDELKQQRGEIDEVQREFGERLRILQGVEVEIRADGELDYPDEVLRGLDIVVASLHSGLRQPREKVTGRTLSAIRNPHVDIIAHPTGRMIPDREGADLDMGLVLESAAAHGVALEINAHPSRLDLDDVYTRRAIEQGVHITINTDAHADSDFNLLHFGVATARRGWATAENVVNAWEPEHLLKWIEGR